MKRWQQTTGGAAVLEADGRPFDNLEAERRSINARQTLAALAGERGQSADRLSEAVENG